MLTFTYEKKEDMINEIRNGALQQNIYEYLEILDEENLLYPQMCNHDLSKDNICDYFEAEVGNTFIGYDNINDPKNEIEILLNNIIMSVYDRWKSDHN